MPSVLILICGSGAIEDGSMNGRKNMEKFYPDVYKVFT
jgi:hypothetical protein